MAKTDFQSVDEYLAAQPEAAQAILRRIRAAIRKALPDAEEVISYQIPAYKLLGGTVLYFAGWKEHFSLYPVGAELVAAFGDELAPLVVSKGTIRFPLSQPVPVKLVERIAKFRGEEARARPKATKRAVRKR
ncbi:MAG TPA: DUF1801 domain-containing protein [Thermoanaerobaculia bacterium]|nr:DUF1801 domain-containing protein [Thermoanaerobaculia bacterium]